MKRNQLIFGLKLLALVIFQRFEWRPIEPRNFQPPLIHCHTALMSNCGKLAISAGGALTSALPKGRPRAGEFTAWIVWSEVKVGVFREHNLSTSRTLSPKYGNQTA